MTARSAASACRLCSLLCALIGVSACSTLPDGRTWGGGVTIAPGWERVRESALDAARDPWVWVPLIAAAAFQIDDLDRRTADWAYEHTPVFGSRENAADWSDDLRTASALSHYATILAAPSGSDAGEWVLDKARGTLVSVAAVSSTVIVTRALKTSVDRERPNSDDSESFPSGHTSSSAVHTRLASRTLRSIEMGRRTRRAFDVGLTALTIGTSWSRIEAGAHFPSDTLVGMALGNVLASFFYDAFMGLDEESSGLAWVPGDAGGELRWRLRF